MTPRDVQHDGLPVPKSTEDSETVPDFGSAQMRHVAVKSLTPQRLDQAYPLVRAIAPALALEDWRAYAAPLIGAQGEHEGAQGGEQGGERASGGILVAEDERGYMAGLVVYRIQRDLLTGPILVAEHFVAFDFFERDRIAEALARALEGLAAGHRCAAVHTVLPEDAERGRRQWLEDMLKLRGHRPHCFALRKALAGGMPIAQPG
jgi:hypothetical protein